MSCSTTGGRVRARRQPPCWWCSKPLSNPFGKPIQGVERNVDGNKVRIHKICSHDFDSEFRKVTAQPSATQSPYDLNGLKEYPGE